MTVIKVFPMLIDPVDDEDAKYFGDKSGTPKFYTVKTILQKYLGKNINVSWNYDDFTFEITNLVQDEGCNKLDNYIEIINDIDESLKSYNFLKEIKKCSIMFMVNDIL